MPVERGANGIEALTHYQFAISCRLAQCGTTLRVATPDAERRATMIAASLRR